VTDKKILYVVHCVDTEGPLHETLNATFKRLESIFGIKLEASQKNLSRIQNKEINLFGKEDEVAKCFSPELLKYNSNWTELEDMLNNLLSVSFRRKHLDDFGNGWVYSWHCMDHIGYKDNPRHKDIGYGNIFRFYKSKLKKSGSLHDELNWHFHPLSLTKSALHCATSYLNSYDVLLQILCRRIIDNKWFPVVNRPGFHSERPDSHAFLEQWIPFDYANQFDEQRNDQPDINNGRFGDWSRAPKTWRGYHPSHDDYQSEGNCHRIIFRCLNVGTRIRKLKQNHVKEAFKEARENGSAILSFADHDFRDMRNDINQVQKMLRNVKKEFPDVLIRYSGAEAAAKSMLNNSDDAGPKLNVVLEKNRLFIEVCNGQIFGPQPFLAIKTKNGDYYHDNLDVIEPRKKWVYTLDEQTLEVEDVEKIGIGTAGAFGGSFVSILKP
tara:strand:+ start:49 stop:1362 length:1314 start_codon:yes stop_codon:yes gene_type:complete